MYANNGIEWMATCTAVQRETATKQGEIQDEVQIDVLSGCES